MARRIAQVRYLGEGNGFNTHEAYALISGDAFQYPIIQLGVQALPGTRIAINGSETPLIIGATGIYELNLDGLGTINRLQFSNASLRNVQDAQSAVIVDYMYET